MLRQNYGGRKQQHHQPGYARSQSRRWRRTPSWGGAPWSYTPDNSNDDDSQNDANDGQEGETTAGDPGGCLSDRCTADYIAWVQQALNQVGSQLKITRILDRETINAINRFKQQHAVPAREYYASPLLEQALVKAGAPQPPAFRRLPCGPSDVKTVLLPLINRYRGSIPPHYLLAWITVESGGKLGDLTKLCERGYFQVHPEESQDLKLDHDRMSTDPAYSVEGGIKLVNYYASGVDKLAKAYGFPRAGDVFWGLVKLRHWIPSASARIILRMRKDNIPIATWDGIRQYVAANPNIGFGGFDVAAGIRSVDNFLATANRWWLWLHGPGASAAAAVKPGQ